MPTTVSSGRPGTTPSTDASSATACSPARRSRRAHVSAANHDEPMPVSSIRCPRRPATRPRRVARPARAARRLRLQIPKELQHPSAQWPAAPAGRQRGRTSSAAGGWPRSGTRGVPGRLARAQQGAIDGAVRGQRRVDAGRDELVDVGAAVRMAALHHDAADVIDRLHHRRDVDQRRLRQSSLGAVGQRIAIEVGDQQRSSARRNCPACRSP